MTVFFKDELLGVNDVPHLPVVDLEAALGKLSRQAAQSKLEGGRWDETPQTISCRCCIVGGGPAGMMLGFLLARAGVDTIVLEKHADFLRDFRGDTIHPSTLEAMHDLGPLEDFLKLPHQELRQGEVKIGDVKLLTVAVDRLPLWHKPGLLCIGDAAHAMSPVGGVGINLAIQDTIAAANILALPLSSEVPLSDQLLAQVQKRREWPTKVIQGMQVLIQKNVISRVLGGTGKIEPPRFLRLFIYFPVLRRLPARLIGLGVRRERVTSPDAAGLRAADYPNSGVHTSTDRP